MNRSLDLFVELPLQGLSEFASERLDARGEVLNGPTALHREHDEPEGGHRPGRQDSARHVEDGRVDEQDGCCPQPDCRSAPDRDARSRILEQATRFLAHVVRLDGAPRFAEDIAEHFLAVVEKPIGGMGVACPLPKVGQAAVGLLPEVEDPAEDSIRGLSEPLLNTPL